MSRLPALALAALLPLASLATAAAPAHADAADGSSSRYIVRADAGGEREARALLAAHGGSVVSDADALGMLVVRTDDATASLLRAVPGISGVSADAAVRLTSLGYDPATQPGSMVNVARVTRATELWKRGITGAGVDVAVLDTGVAPVAGLSGADKVVVGPDLSFESQVPALRNLDTYGHGTHMAGIIGGREGGRRSGAQYAADRTTFLGMAPDARIVSVKLADHNGAVDVSQVIAAINWVVQNKRSNGLNIRVLNLSFGTESPQSPQLDPLSWAAETAWFSGLAVVAAAGNDGGKVTGLANPAYNPWVIAVGAVDTKGTDSRSDDVIAGFSARAGRSWGARPVDVVAPGVGIVAPGVPGSLLWEGYPGARLGSGQLRGSGTSQAAAVVSGAVALLLQHRPSLTPDQVKDVLVDGASPLLRIATTAQGRGELDVLSASWQLPLLTQSQLRGSGTGSLETARGGFHVEDGGATLTGEVDILGGAWDAPAFAAATRSRTSWGADGSFNGNLWTGQGFVADGGWAGATWGGTTWSGRTWSGRTWSGRTWSGRTWSSAEWSGSGWSSAAWGSSVAPSSWAGSLWATGSWG